MSRDLTRQTVADFVQFAIYICKSLKAEEVVLSPKAREQPLRLLERCGASRRYPLLGFTAISDQTNHNKIFERAALQPFQKFYWFGFERKAL